MMNVDLLRGYYTGSRTKIALIDTGVSAEIVTKATDIHLFAYSLKTGQVEECSSAVIYSNHGTSCGRMILTVAPKATIYSINVEDEHLHVSEDAVVAAIRFAIAEKCDVINLSIGFLAYSDKVYIACREAYENHVIINTAAAHDVSAVFPADYGTYTLKVLDNQEPFTREGVKRIDDRVYEVSFLPLRETVYDSVSGIQQETVTSGSSLASAYLTGLIALYIESRPFLSKEELMKELFRATDLKGEEKEKSTEPIRDMDSLYTVLSTYYDCEKYREIMNPAFAEAYDPRNGPAVNEISTRHLYVVNPLGYSRMPLQENSFRNTTYIGDFEWVDSYRGKVLDHENNMRRVKTPLILIAGVGQSCGKFNVQLELKLQMQVNGLSNYCMTYNPLGYLYDMDYLRYPSMSPFQDIVYSINQHVKDIEDEEDFDCFILNVAGGMFPLSRSNANHFGMLYQAYLSAVSMDYLVICTNSKIHPKVIKREIDKLKLMMNFDAAIVIADLTYDEASVNSSRMSIPYPEDATVIQATVDEYEKYIDAVPIYTQKEVAEGALIREILNKLG